MTCCTENTTLTRRRLLGAAAAATAATLVTEGVSTRYAFAAPGPAGTLATAPGDTLVVLSLRGGFDGLSAVVPHGDADYYRARPTIAVPKAKLIGGDAMFGLHPALAPLLPLWQGGPLAAGQAGGPADPAPLPFAPVGGMARGRAGTST